MIEPIMPYTNVEIFREKEAKTFSKKVWEPLNFMKKIFDNINLNLNLNHKCLVLTWRKPTWFFINGGARGYSSSTPIFVQNRWIGRRNN
jgi:hypothetical protein